MDASVEVSRIIADAMSVPGWLNEVEAAYLARLTLQCPVELRVVELGAWMGRSTVVLAKARELVADALSVITVDNFLGGPEHHLDADGALRLYKAWDATVNRFGLRVNLMQMDSAVAPSLLRDGADIGLLFVDAGHEYESVVADLSGWFGHIAQYGYIAVHDYTNLDFPGVKQAVDEFFQIMARHRMIKYLDVGSMWVGRKL